MKTVVLMMGVCGSGKSTIGRLLSDNLKCNFIEADLFHTAENIAKMSDNIPLNDSDRIPWLNAVAEAITTVAISATQGYVIVACSALKRMYRDILINCCMKAGIEDFITIFLDTPLSMAKSRVCARHSHFMPTSLVESQFASLEPPEDAEYVHNKLIIVDMSNAGCAQDIAMHLSHNMPCKCP